MIISADLIWKYVMNDCNIKCIISNSNRVLWTFNLISVSCKWNYWNYNMSVCQWHSNSRFFLPEIWQIWNMNNFLSFKIFRNFVWCHFVDHLKTDNICNLFLLKIFISNTTGDSVEETRVDREKPQPCTSMTSNTTNFLASGSTELGFEPLVVLRVAVICKYRF